MNTNISCLYESVILEQQVNYFILENKYISLNEANSKGILSKIKNFIIEKIQSFIRIIGKFIGIIRNFLSKFFPFLKKKNNDAKGKCKNINKVMINTVDVKKAAEWIDDIKDIIFVSELNTNLNLDVALGYLNNKNDSFKFKKDDLDKSKEYLKDTIEMFKENKEKISKIGDGEIVTVNQPLSTITNFYNKFESEVKIFQDNLQKHEKYMNEVLRKCKTITIDGVDDESQRQTMMNLSIEYFTSENSCITTGYNKIINIIQTMNPTKVLNAVEKYPDVAGKYDTIEQALTNNNTDKLREYVASIFYNSRDNLNGEIDAMLGYIEARGIKIKDDKLNGKLISDGKDTYTDEDFKKAVYELEKNFCGERINDVKKIGKALYGKDELAKKNSKKGIYGI